jgi:type II secretory pathway pseudopilin PulG
VTRDDAGETLIELLVAIVVMGIAVVVIMAGFATVILMSDVHRKQATAGAYVHDYAEAIENTVNTVTMVNGKPVDGYQVCAGTATYASAVGFTDSAYTASVASVRYWSGSAWQTSCTPATDTGLQQLTVQVASTDGRAKEQLTIVLRRPCSLQVALCS